VAEIADRAVVMYKGEIVEQGPVKNIFASPQHPYTKALLACRPVNHPRGERLPVVSDFMGAEKTSLAKTTGSVVNIAAPKDAVLIEVKDLSVWFPARRTLLGKPKDFIKAV